MLYVVPATARHAKRIGPYLREADALEATTLTGRNPTDALLHALTVSTECYTVLKDGVPVGMFGHQDFGDGIGGIWLLGTPAMTANIRDFLESSYEWWERITHRYDTCWNRVWEGNRLHRRWLEWMGCEFDGYTVLEGDPPRLFRGFKYVRTSSNPSGPVRGVRGGNHRRNSAAGPAGEQRRQRAERQVQVGV